VSNVKTKKEKKLLGGVVEYSHGGTEENHCLGKIILRIKLNWEAPK
jgi:hypothetical protein